MAAPSRFNLILSRWGADTLMDMPHADFTAALARVHRAGELRQAMWSCAAEHLKDHPVELWFDDRCDEVRVMASATAEFPMEISILFGEWLYNLRTALDSLLYELAVEDTGQDPPTGAGNRKYPIIAEPNRFAEATKRSLAGLTDWSRKFIEDTQPYHSTGGANGSALWWLDELAKIDRHRRHHAVAWRVVELDIRPSPELFVQSATRMCDERATFLGQGLEVELAAFQKISGPRCVSQGHAMDVGRRIEFDIPDWVRRAHPGLVADVRTDDRMRTVEIVVGDTITALRDRLPTRPPANGPLKRIPAVPGGPTGPTSEDQ